MSAQHMPRWRRALKRLIIETQNLSPLPTFKINANGTGGFGCGGDDSRSGPAFPNQDDLSARRRPCDHHSRLIFALDTASRAPLTAVGNALSTGRSGCSHSHSPPLTHDANGTPGSNTLCSSSESLRTASPVCNPSRCGRSDRLAGAADFAGEKC